MDVDKLLASLKEHGTIDVEEASFTLSLTEARRKMVQYRTSDPYRYLLFLVAGLQAAGAEEVVFTRENTTVHVECHSVTLDEEALASAMAGETNEREHPGLTDLCLAIRTAFRVDCILVDLVASKESEEGFHWSLTQEGETSESVPPTGLADRVSLSFEFSETWTRRAAGWFGFLRGWVGNNKEFRLLESYCDRSLVPVLVDNKSISKAFIPPPPETCARVGNCPDDLQADLCLEDHPWSGIVSLEKGRLSIVRHGVTYARLEGTGLSGVIWYDALGLDLSREQITHDATYEQLTDDLEKLWLRLLNSYLARPIDVSRKIIMSHLHDAVEACVLGDHPELLGRIGQWMSKQFKGYRSVPDSRQELVVCYQALTQVFSGFKPRPRMLLELCAVSLVERLPGMDELLSDTATMIQKNYPEDRLAAGYLLLGLGACLHNFGMPGTGKKVWEEALQTAGKGSRKNEELIRAHLEYQPDHMMLEVAKALKIYIHSKKELSG